jgi:uncharacterized sulfatase
MCPSLPAIPITSPSTASSGTAYPDPTGSNLQGTYGDDDAQPLPYHNDTYTANQAVSYLKQVKANDAPFCLTVGFVNPHDREFFPAGTEFQTMTNVFANKRLNPQGLKQNIDYSVSGPQVPWEKDKLKSPPSYGFPFLPPNWETPAIWKAQKKPTTQTFIRDFQQMIWGGTTDNPLQLGFRVVPYGHNDTGCGIGKAPFYYWQRGLDSYA